MPTKAKLMGAGLPAAVATTLLGGGLSSLTATGTSQTDAFLIFSDVNNFATVASGTGAILSFAFQPGDTTMVYNGGANALLLYPDVGSSINALSANASYSIAAGKLCLIAKISPTQYATNLSA